jgi:large subunit ribosomal protein L12
MIYVYTAMLLHKAEKPVNEASVKKVLEAVGVTPDEGRIKALVAALDGVDIEAAIKEAAMPVAAPVAAVVSAPAEEKKVKEEKKDDNQAAAGLGALFG